MDEIPFDLKANEIPVAFYLCMLKRSKQECAGCPYRLIGCESSLMKDTLRVLDGTEEYEEAFKLFLYRDILKSENFGKFFATVLQIVGKVVQVIQNG